MTPHPHNRYTVEKILETKCTVLLYGLADFAKREMFLVNFTDAPVTSSKQPIKFEGYVDKPFLFDRLFTYHFPSGLG